MATRSNRLLVRLPGDGLVTTVRNRRISELRRMAVIQGEPVPEVATATTMKQLLSNTMGYYLWVRDVVGKMKPEEFWLTDPRTGERVPCAEFEMEQRMLTIAKCLIESIERLDLDKRSVEVEEAKLEILTGMLAQAAEDAGLDEESRRKLGISLRRQIKQLNRAQEAEAA